MRLTKKDIERANQRRKYSDGRGLFLSVSKNGRKSWAFCYTMNGKAREMGLGSVDFMTIDQARDRAVQLRLMVKAGADPMEDRDRARAAIVRAKASGTSFRDVAESLIKKMKSGWSKNGKSEASSGFTYRLPKLAVIMHATSPRKMLGSAMRGPFGRRFDAASWT